MAAEKESLFSKNGKICDYSQEEVLKTFMLDPLKTDAFKTVSKNASTHPTIMDDEFKHAATNLDRFYLTPLILNLFL